MSEHPYLQWPVFRRSIVAAFDRSLTDSSPLPEQPAGCWPAGHNRYTVVALPNLGMAKAPRRKVRRLPKGRHPSISRLEMNRLVDLLNERGEMLNRVLRDQEIQFARIAQIQADLDVMKARYVRTKP